MSIFQLSLIESDQDYQACFEVMCELRPHLTDAATFAAQARRQAGQGYRLLAAWRDGRVKGLAGYRIQENLLRSEEHTSELQSLMRTSYAVFCLKKKEQLNQ